LCVLLHPTANVDAASRTTLAVVWSCQMVPPLRTLRFKILYVEAAASVTRPPIVMGMCATDAVTEMTLLTRLKALAESMATDTSIMPKASPREVAPHTPSSELIEVQIRRAAGRQHAVEQHGHRHS
jgi:hypothetical protein